MSKIGHDSSSREHCTRASSVWKSPYPFAETCKSVFSRVALAIDGHALVRALAALLPLIILAWISGRTEWLKVSLVTISTIVAVDRSHLAPFGVITHGAAIGAGFLVLMASFAYPPLFVGVTILLAMGSMLVTTRGSELRALGSYTFIPVLYLTCESAEGVKPSDLIQRGWETLPFIGAAFLPVLLMCAIDHFRNRRPDVPWLTHFAKWSRRSSIGNRVPYVEVTMVVALAVGVAAALVEWRHIEHGEWMIWSTASVVIAGAASARLKFRHRLTGALVGVPVGIVVGLLVPHDAFA